MGHRGRRGRKVPQAAAGHILQCKQRCTLGPPPRTPQFSWQVARLRSSSRHQGTPFPIPCPHPLPVHRPQGQVRLLLILAGLFVASLMLLAFAWAKYSKHIDHYARLQEAKKAT